MLRALLFLTFVAGWAMAAEENALRASTTGFYPIWENTGHIEHHREIHLGTTGAQVGILNRLHLGVSPMQFLYRAPNLYAKLALHDDESWHVAFGIGATYLMERAGRASFSPMYTSRLDNYDYSVFLLPLTATASLAVGDWLEVHQTVTALGLATSGPLKNEVSFGYSVVGEFNPRGHHAALLHAGEVGLWSHDHVVLGVSYRYRNGWFEGRLGYFYRLRPTGTQGAPLVGLGFLL